VADFGLAAVYQHMNEDARYLRHTKVGSVMYAAPEVLTSTAQAGYDAAAADMWSLGIILFSMLSGTLPFQCAAASRCKRYAAVLQQGIQVMCPDTLSPDVTALLARMIHPDPKQRYTPEQVAK
jgi:serine/threonine protein kinase